MKITKEYLNKHKTNAGGYTRSQIQALGQDWNHLGKGWAKRLIGTELSDENAARFESKQTAKEVRGIAKESYADLVKSVKILQNRVIELEFLLAKKGPKSYAQWKADILAYKFTD